MFKTVEETISILGKDLNQTSGVEKYNVWDENILVEIKSRLDTTE